MPTRPRQRAFTLVELIVVIVILGVLFLLTVPRLTSTEARRAENEVRSVALLLSAIAQRDALGSQRLSLAYDAADRRLSASVFRSTGDAINPDGRWSSDPLLPPVVFEAARLETALFDGARADSRGWTIELFPGVGRPTIQLVFAAGEAQRPSRWLVDLLPYSTMAAVATPSGGLSRPTAVDLDAQGMRLSPW
ncbi:MAG: prepilin-type N-terminal cleavage/methylation domain-containing protein [Phycisphaerales bacterium]|nr:prepilin-type N-terminal cleavage/methylation domain-containing protein [Phycisphaerales bacterium]